MAKFNLELDDRERGLLLFALGSIAMVLPSSIALAQRVATLGDVATANPRPPVGMPANVGTPTAPAPSTASQPARSPDYDTELSVRTDTITKVGDRLVLKWKDAQTSAIRQATCWDSDIFAKVLATVKQPSTYLIKTKQKGTSTYLNVVGVK